MGRKEAHKDGGQEHNEEDTYGASAGRGRVGGGAIARHDFVLARRDAPEGQCAAGRQDAHASEHAQHAIPPRTLLQRAEREAGEGTAGLRDALDESPRRAAHARWDNLTRKEAKQHVHRESAKADVEVARLDQKLVFDQAHGEQPGRNQARSRRHGHKPGTGPGTARRARW